MNKVLIATYELDPIDCNYLEYCKFEEESYKDLLSYILLIRDEFSLDYNKENYEHFMQEYQQIRLRYKLKVTQMIENYCPQYRGSIKHDFNIDFEHCTLSIYDLGGE